MSKTKLWTWLAAVIFAANSAIAAPGDNVARGRQYILSQVPNYALCTNSTDGTDLTDGVKLTGGYHTELGAVGWYGKGSVSITINLGSKKAIQRINFRCNFGPEFIHVWLSDTGATYSYAGELISLSWPNGLPDTDGPLRGAMLRVWEYSAGNQVWAGKLVKLTCYRAGGFMFSDEIEIIEGDFPAANYVPGPTQLSGSSNFDTWATNNKTDGILRVRMLRDLQELDRHPQAASYTSQISSLRSQVTAMPFTSTPIDFRKGLPYNDLHAQIWALYGQMNVAQGYAIHTVSKAKLYEPLHPFDIFSSDTSTCQIDLIKNEKRAAAINISNFSSAAKTAQASLSFTGIACPSENISLKEVRFTEVQNHAVVASGMVDANRVSAYQWDVNLPAGATSQIWFEIEGKGLARGTYSGQIVITPQGSSATTVPLQIVVHRGQRGIVPALGAATFDYATPISSYGAVTADNVLPYVSTLQAAGISCFSLPPAAFFPVGYTRNSNGTFNIPPIWPNLNKWLDDLAKLPAVVKKYHIALDFPNYENHYSGANTRGTPEYTTAVQSFFLNLAAEIDKRGLQRSRFVFLVSDEPPFYSSIDQASADFTNIAKAAVPEFLFMIDPVYKNVSEIDTGGDNYIRSSDIIMVNWDNFLLGGANLENYYRNILSSGNKEFATYRCAGGGLGRSPVEYFRQMAWNAWTKGMTMIGCWAAAAQGGPTWDPWLAEERYEMVMLGNNFCDSDKITTSWRDGIQDYEYLYVLDKLNEKATSNFAPSYLTSYAQSVLTNTPTNALAAVPDDSVWSYNSNNEAFDTARLDVLAAIDVLGSLMPLQRTLLSDDFAQAGFDAAKWQRRQPLEGGSTNMTSAAGGQLVATAGEELLTLGGFNAAIDEIRLNVKLVQHTSGDSFIVRTYDKNLYEYLEFSYNDSTKMASLKRKYTGSTLTQTLFNSIYPAISLPAKLAISIDKRNIQIRQMPASGASGSISDTVIYDGVHGFADANNLRFALTNKTALTSSNVVYDDAVISQENIITEPPAVADCNEVWAVESGLAADINHDCVVNMLDMQLLADRWLLSEISPQPLVFDFESDDYVSGQPLAGTDGWSYAFGSTTGSAITPDPAGSGVTTVLAGAKSAVLNSTSVTHRLDDSSPLFDDSEIACHIYILPSATCRLFLSNDLVATPIGIELASGIIRVYGKDGYSITGLTYTEQNHFIIGMRINFTDQTCTISKADADGSNRVEAGPYNTYPVYGQNVKLMGGLIFTTVNKAVIDNISVNAYVPTDCADSWNHGFGTRQDINKDCIVNLTDYALLLQQWLNCNEPTSPECIITWF